MAQARQQLPSPIPAPTQSEVIDELKEELTNLLDLFAKERTEIVNEEAAIMADKDVDFVPPQVVPDETLNEELYEIFAPRFVSANSFLKHVLENSQQETNEARLELHQLLEMTDAQFKQLSEDDKHRYLLIICVITDAIIQDMRVLANKYQQELDLCLNSEIFREAVEDAAIQTGAIAIFIATGMNVPVYHPDHDKEFAEYRQSLYSKIAGTDLKLHQFFALMQAHVGAAMTFVKKHKLDLNAVAQDKPEEEKKEPAPLVSKEDAAALIAFRTLSDSSKAKDQETPAPTEGRKCVIL